MDWYQAIHDFLMNAQNTNWLKEDSVGNISFEATVRISSQSATCRENTHVRIIRNGFEDGTIKIEEAGELTAKAFHTEYKPIGRASCHYAKSTQSLLLSGQSQKLGAYEVAITPIDA